MRRGKFRKFGRQKNQRKALYKALATALIEHGRIKTTVAKSKSLSSFIEKLVTTARKGGLESRRLISEDLGEKSVS